MSVHDHERSFISLCLWFLFSLIPKNIVSFIVGWFARLAPPKILKGPISHLFVSIFRINMSEAEKALSEYATIEEIFTRKLKAGSREITEGFCSPVDGMSCQSDFVEDGQKAIQVKGIYYSLNELVYGEDQSQKQRPLSWFSTIYLAPHNYHRVHAPISGKLKEIRYFGGELWPVNPPFVKVVPDLFVRNERLVFEIQLEQGCCFVVMVGALNVGRMVTPFWPNMITNDSRRVFEHTNELLTFSEPIAVNCGDELGTFMLGSTVVIVFDKTAASSLDLKVVPKGAVVMGQALLD